jgi:hypothetical protein
MIIAMEVIIIVGSIVIMMPQKSAALRVHAARGRGVRAYQCGNFVGVMEMMRSREADSHNQRFSESTQP